MSGNGSAARRAGVVAAGQPAYARSVGAISAYFSTVFAIKHTIHGPGRVGTYNITGIGAYDSRNAFIGSPDCGFRAGSAVRIGINNGRNPIPR